MLTKAPLLMCCSLQFFNKGWCHYIIGKVVGGLDNEQAQMESGYHDFRFTYVFLYSLLQFSTVIKNDNCFICVVINNINFQTTTNQSLTFTWHVCCWIWDFISPPAEQSANSQGSQPKMQASHSKIKRFLVWKPYMKSFISMQLPVSLNFTTPSFKNKSKQANQDLGTHQWVMWMDN